MRLAMKVVVSDLKTWERKSEREQGRRLDSQLDYSVIIAITLTRLNLIDGRRRSERWGEEKKIPILY